MKLLEFNNFITRFDALDKELCLDIIKLFENDQRKWVGKVQKHTGEIVEDDAKKSTDLEIINQGEWKDIYEKLHRSVMPCIQYYISGSPALKSLDLEGTGFKIQKYNKEDGHFQWHCDNHGRESLSRVVAVICYLNTVDEGGETEFYHYQVKVKPQTGNVVLFPTSWNYMHCGRVPISEDKYIITCFLQVKGKSSQAHPQRSLQEAS